MTARGQTIDFSVGHGHVLGETELAIFQGMRNAGELGVASPDLEHARLLLAGALNESAEEDRYKGPVQDAINDHYAAFAKQKVPEIWHPAANLKTVTMAVGCELDSVALTMLEKFGRPDVWVPSNSEIGDFAWRALYNARQGVYELDMAPGEKLPLVAAGRFALQRGLMLVR